MDNMQYYLQQPTEQTPSVDTSNQGSPTQPLGLFNLSQDTSALDLAKMQEEKLKVAQEYMKFLKDFEANQGIGKPYNVQGQPDSGLVQEEMQEMKQFLQKLSQEMGANIDPNGKGISVDPKLVHGAMKNIDQRINNINSQLSKIQPAGGTIPQALRNVFNELQLEQKALNNYKTLLGTINPQNPTLNSDAINQVFNVMNMYESQKGPGQNNLYSADLKSILGDTTSPQVKNMQDLLSRTQYIDKFISPYITRKTQSVMNPQGADPISNVNARLNEGQQGIMEDAAAEAVVQLVHQTYTLPKEQRESFWNMFPLWAASQGLNWSNIKRKGVQLAEEKSRKWDEGLNKTSVPNVESVSTKQSSEGMGKRKESQQVQPEPQGSRLGKFLGNTLYKGAEDIQAQTAPGVAAIKYLLGNPDTSYLQNLKEAEPQYIQEAMNFPKNLDKNSISDQLDQLASKGVAASKSLLGSPDTSFLQNLKEAEPQYIQDARNNPTYFDTNSILDQLSPLKTPNPYKSKVDLSQNQ